MQTGNSGGRRTAETVCHDDVASAPSPTAIPARTAASTTAAVGGSAALSINSGLSVQPGAANPLARHLYVLLRDSVADLMAKAGVQVPAGTSQYKVMTLACLNHTPDCRKIVAAVQASAASSARADANGKATLPSVAADTYYLMITARYNNQALAWDKALQLNAGTNSLTLDQTNASTIR